MANPLRRQYSGIYPLLGIVFIAMLLASISFGAIHIPLGTILTAFKDKMNSRDDSMPLIERIFIYIRLPRAILCMLVGASLAVGGVLMQALFRNPIVEPGLVGTSSGAAFGSALFFVLGATWHLNTGEWTLPIVACAGGVLSTYLVLLLSENKGRGSTTVVSLLLTGIAINALFLSGIGFLSYIARDPQARSIVFWNLGSLAGASWNAVITVGISTLLCFILALRYAKQLNVLMMGEEEAQNLGVNIKRLKLIVLTINVIMVAVATAFVGVISFVGLIVPHILRMWKGSDNRFLVIAGAFLGGILLSAADLVARLIIAPAELPIGIVTSVVGVPVFLILLRRRSNYL